MNYRVDPNKPRKFLIRLTRMPKHLIRRLSPTAYKLEHSMPALAQGESELCAYKARGSGDGELHAPYSR
ncbi:MAG: hypothetical protein ACI8PQ_002319 [Planctomycetota bacterium]